MDSIPKVPPVTFKNSTLSRKEQIYLLYYYTMLLVYLFFRKWNKVSKKTIKLFLLKKITDPNFSQTHHANIDKSNILLNQNNTFIPTTHLILHVIVEQPLQVNANPYISVHWSSIPCTGRLPSSGNLDSIFASIELKLNSLWLLLIFPSSHLLEDYT